MISFILLIRKPRFHTPFTGWFVSPITFVLFTTAQIPQGHRLIVTENAYLYSDPPHSVALLWKRDQPDADTATWYVKHNTQKRKKNVLLAGFEVTIPLSARRQTHNLDCGATGTGNGVCYRTQITGAANYAIPSRSICVQNPQYRLVLKYRKQNYEDKIKQIKLAVLLFSCTLLCAVILTAKRKV
jgi:hypothetical protein